MLDRPLPILPLLILCASLLFAPDVQANEEEPQFPAESLEFFEKKVRPILVRRCYQCHSNTGKKRGGLHLDTRQAVLEGGDTGPAVAPGDPRESLLIDAVNYGDVYQMPPKSKLPAEEIAALTKWVKLGAPWPAGEKVKQASAEAFDLEKRMASHWAWKPLASPPTPLVASKDWPADPLDYFVLQRLEEAGLTPAADAEKAVLVRRLYFDLIGIPPTPEQVDAFLQDRSPEAVATLVDRLLDSPRFGERWGRHWLDLVRYAESRGHEFDYNTPNAYQYRDYVVRAFNADVPYDKFVVEHIAGDLLTEPRRHPTTKANESILGTGFWFLGEWVHSPVDIRKDETDRFDNMVDVFSKTFLGLTVACARCHDHKFDAISQADYYALFGYLQSSAYRQARFESLDHNRKIAEEAEELREKHADLLRRVALDAPQSEWDALALYLSAARECLARPVEAAAGEDLIVEDFESGELRGWKLEGDAFNGVPQEASSIAAYQGDVGARGKFFINSHNVRDALGEKSRHGDGFVGKMTSPPFTIERGGIQLLVGGGSHRNRTCVNLRVDGKTVRTATGKNNNRMSLVTWNVAEFRGKTAVIEVVDQHRGGWGNISLDHVVQTNNVENAGRVVDPALREVIAEVASKSQLDAKRLESYCEALITAEKAPSHPLRALALTLQDDKAQEEYRRLVSKPVSSALPEDARVVADFREGRALMQDGVSFGVKAVRVGDLLIDGDRVALSDVNAARRSPLFRKLKLAGGTQRDSGRLSGWDRAGKTLRTKTFPLDSKRLFYLVRGRGLAYAVVDSHRMINGPLHGRILKQFDTKGEFQWIDHDLARYSGHNAHIEFTVHEESPLDVVLVVQAPSKPEMNLAAFDAHDRRLAQLLGGSVEKLTQAVARTTQDSIRAFLNDRSGNRNAVRASWLLANHALWSKHRAKDIVDKKSALLDAWKRLASKVRVESRTGLAMWDGTSQDDFLLIRGNNRTPGKTVRRRFLTALGGRDEEYAGSGRLQLARQLLNRENPFPSRVMVNRVWHHLIGRGIVPSTDNFGVLGRAPSHPKLLDHLAIRFMDEGWSLKSLIRSIVLSRTYRMSSSPSEEATKKDPSNVLIHRMRIRRLEAEPIRDAILHVSGRLDETMYGPSVPVYLTPFMQGRGRPRGGPLDGQGRRSIYISIRRNFLSPMMLAFDAPQPFSSVGTRTVSNVPAQALILMNDPFVVGEAKRWATSVVEDLSTDKDRIGRIYRQAFSREPTDSEMEAAVSFLDAQAEALGLDRSSKAGDVRPWADLCHVLINVKEFIFIR